MVPMQVFLTRLEKLAKCPWSANWNVGGCVNYVLLLVKQCRVLSKSSRSVVTIKGIAELITKVLKKDSNDADGHPSSRFVRKDKADEILGCVRLPSFRIFWNLLSPVLSTPSAWPGKYFIRTLLRYWGHPNFNVVNISMHVPMNLWCIRLFEFLSTQ